MRLRGARPFTFLHKALVQRGAVGFPRVVSAEKGTDGVADAERVSDWADVGETPSTFTCRGREINFTRIIFSKI